MVKTSCKIEIYVFPTFKKIPTEDLVKMAGFVLKNNYFEFNGSIKQQISGTAIGTKFAPPYACIFMDKFETNFLKTQTLQPLVWFRYINDVFLFMDSWRGKSNNFYTTLIIMILAYSLPMSTVKRKYHSLI